MNGQKLQSPDMPRCDYIKVTNITIQERAD